MGEMETNDTQSGILCRFGTACEGTSSRASVWGAFLSVLVIGMAIAFVYGPTIDAPLIFDDEVTLLQNPSIHQLWPLIGNAPDFGPLHPSPGTPVSARPLVNLTFAANYYFDDVQPRGYRVVNIIIHALAACLLWVLVSRTLRLPKFKGQYDSSAGWIGFLSALIWAVHPVNTETVVYITQRTELMVGLFYIATVLASSCYLNANRRATRVASLALAVTASLAGMVSKEMMVSVPAVVLVYHRVFFERSFGNMIRDAWKLYACLVLSWGPLATLYAYGFRTPGGGLGEGVALHHWWLSQSPVVFLYWRMAFWPWPLVIHYQFPVLTELASAWPWVIGNVILIGVSVLGFARRLPIAFVIIAFYAILSPTLLIPLPMEPAVERRMYLPLAVIVPWVVASGCGLMLAALKRSETHWIRNVFSTVSIATILVVVVLFATLSKRRLELFQDQLALWQDALVHQPRNPIALYSVGTLLALDGKVKESALYFEKSFQSDPTYYKSSYNLAHAWDRLGKNQEAIKQYRKTLQIKPQDPATHLNLGRLLEYEGQPRQAIFHYREAISATPDFALARTNLGLLLLSQGQEESAIKQLQTALEFDQDLPQYMNLVMAYSQAGRAEDVIKTLEAAFQFASDRGDSAVADKLRRTIERLQP